VVVPNQDIHSAKAPFINTQHHPLRHLREPTQAAKKKPDVGLEPTTLRLRVSRATDCASRADVMKHLLMLMVTFEIWWYCISLNAKTDIQVYLPSANG
jgi:hypothetical protein